MANIAGHAATMPNRKRHSHLKESTLAILVGGRSQRLGSEKGLYNPLGDETLIEHKIRTLGTGFKNVLVITRDHEQLALYKTALEHRPNNIEIVSDEDHQSNPPNAALTGVLTALINSQTEHNVIVPVDQLGLKLSHIERLGGAFQAYCDEEGNIIPFPLVLNKSVHKQQLAARVAGGALSIKGLVDSLGLKLMPAESLAKELSTNGNTKEQIKNHFGTPLVDSQGRRLHYLRFSLTEACNLSCEYCLPDGYPEWYRHKATLNRDQIATLLTGFRRLGFRKVRFTGGEPTIHPRCLDSVRLARQLGFEQIALTTNGLLIDNVKQWQEAGLTSLNISLDSVNADTFKKLTKSGELNKVLRLVDMACETNLQVKINTVLLRSVNGSADEIKALINWASQRPLTLRFIELMETKLNSSFSESQRVLGSEIVPHLEKLGYSQKPQTSPIRLGGPETPYISKNFVGRFGLINPMSCNFCSDCNRLRVTAKGHLKLCLFSSHDSKIDLSSAESVEQSVRSLIGSKQDQHGLVEHNTGNVYTFRTIGG